MITMLKPGSYGSFPGYVPTLVDVDMGVVSVAGVAIDDTFGDFVLVAVEYVEVTDGFNVELVIVSPEWSSSFKLRLTVEKNQITTIVWNA